VDSVREPITNHLPSLGRHLRAARKARSMSLRALASRIGVSASLISQIETGKVQPSVTTLHALAMELSLSLDCLLFDGSAWEGAVPLPSVVRAADRPIIEVAPGVRWERLSASAEPGRDFLYIVYESGATAIPEGSTHRHAGREWGLVLSGTLTVQLGEELHILGPGDAITYDTRAPHRLSNEGDEPVRAIWYVLGSGDQAVTNALRLRAGASLRRDAC
jgi:transcriptional regulator with XRE-family HTH domain